MPRNNSPSSASDIIFHFIAQCLGREFGIYVLVASINTHEHSSGSCCFSLFLLIDF